MVKIGALDKGLGIYLPSTLFLFQFTSEEVERNLDDWSVYDDLLENIAKPPIRTIFQ